MEKISNCAIKLAIRDYVDSVDNEGGKYVAESRWRVDGETAY